jgi:hypothetical protein
MGPPATSTASRQPAAGGLSAFLIGVGWLIGGQTGLVIGSSSRWG